MENGKASAAVTSGKVIRCKAAISRNPGEALVIEEIEVDPPKPYEVRIKILCTSLCHTDVSVWKLDLDHPASAFPRIFGHEAVGVVESVGENVEEVGEGDLVLPVFQRQCGDCGDCKRPNSNACKGFLFQFDKMPRDGTSRFRGVDGEVVNHFMFVSSFSEYTVVDIAHIVKIPAGIPVEKACLLSCGVSTGVGAVWKVADVAEGSIVAIFGLGAVGLAVAEGARSRGASKIIGIDLNIEKFEIGKKYGVTDFINPANCGNKAVSEIIKEMTDGGADYCFECIGLASLMQEAFTSARQGCGKTVLLGVDMNSLSLPLNPHEFLQGRTVVGAYFGGLKPKSDVPFLVKKYINKELNLDGFITHEVDFQDINKAFDLLLQGKSLRCIIWMDK